MTSGRVSWCKSTITASPPVQAAVSSQGRNASAAHKSVVAPVKRSSLGDEVGVGLQPGLSQHWCAEPRDAEPFYDLAAQKTLSTKDVNQRSCLVVDPRASKFLIAWDIVIGVVLAFTALITPFEVAFLPSPTTAADPLFLINRFVDMLFIVDIHLNFRMMHPRGVVTDQAGKTHLSLWEDDLGAIARNYLLGWFAIDISSVAVSSIDFIALAHAAEEEERTSATRGLKLLRVLRGLRLIKLFRLVRASRILKRWETRIAINYAVLKLAQSIGFVLCTMHWVGCIWGLQTTFADSVLETWMGSYNYCHLANRTLDTDYGTESSIICPSPTQLYVACVCRAQLELRTGTHAHATDRCLHRDRDRYTGQ
eukprot:4713933-Prymnesium_polylepis.1